MLFKNSLQLVAELAAMDCAKCSADGDSVRNVEVGSILDHIGPLSKAFELSAESVRVFHADENYVVEFDELAKFMLGNKIKSFREAIDKIADANLITDLGICIDEEVLEEASKAAKKAKSKVCPKCGKTADKCTCDHKDDVCKKCGKPKAKCTCDSKSKNESTDYENSIAILRACVEQGISLYKH